MSKPQGRGTRDSSLIIRSTVDWIRIGAYQFTNGDGRAQLRWLIRHSHRDLLVLDVKDVITIPPESGATHVGNCLAGI